MTTPVSPASHVANDAAPAPEAIDAIVRRIEPQDAATLRRFYAALSNESRRRRFLSASTRFGEGDSQYLCGPDHEHREGYVAELTSPNGDRQIIGHVCMEPCGQQGMEIAIAVADRFQEHGIGRRLADEAIGWADAHGIQHVLAWSAWDNSAIRRLFEGLHRPIHHGSSWGSVETIIELRPRSGALDAA